MNIEANDRYAHGGKAIYGARLGIMRNGKLSIRQDTRAKPGQP